MFFFVVDDGETIKEESRSQIGVIEATTRDVISSFLLLFLLHFSLCVSFSVSRRRVRLRLMKSSMISPSASSEDRGRKR